MTEVKAEAMTLKRRELRRSSRSRDLNAAVAY